MTEWYSSLDDFDKAVWAIAMVTSLIFVIQMTLTFLGMDSEQGVEADFSGNINSDVDLGGTMDMSGDAPFQLFTFRNLINFLLGFSWGVIAFKGTFESQTALVVCGFLSGALLVTLVMLMFRQLGKMQQSGNMNINLAVGKEATVYLRIPGAKSGSGKVQISLQGGIRELDAITEGDEIPTGKSVMVKAIINGKLLVE
jgi:hypothetical protein